MDLRKILLVGCLAAAICLASPGLLPSLGLADPGSSAGVVLALAYDWTGAGNNGNWNNEDNWHPSGFCDPCYPNTTNDDANITLNDTIDLVDGVETDDLRIVAEGSNVAVTFDDADSLSTPTTLTIDNLTLSGPDIGQGGHTVTVTFTGGAKIAG